MLSNAYFLAKFRFDTAENEPAKNLQNFANFPILLTQGSGRWSLLPRLRVSTVGAAQGAIGWAASAWRLVAEAPAAVHLAKSGRRAAKAKAKSGAACAKRGSGLAKCRLRRN